MNRLLASLSTLALVAFVGCSGENPTDANKTKATAETPKTADSQATPPPMGSGTTSAEAPKTAVPDPSGSAHEGGDKDPKKDHDKAAEGTGDKAEKVIHLAHAKLEFNHPGAGWTESKKGKWTLLRPADKTSVLAFVEFEKAGEATADLAKIAESLELTDLKWKGEPKKLKVGPDKLEARFAEGACKVASNKHDCEIEYYAVDGSTLIVYAFETDTKKADKHEKIATKTVESIRRSDGAAEAGPEHKGHGKKK